MKTNKGLLWNTRKTSKTNKKEIRAMFESLYNREKIIIHEKMKQTKKESSSNVAKTEKVKAELDYKYYKCDYCNQEIKLTDRKHERSGGIVVFPASLTKRRSLQLVLHNKCLNPAKRVFEGGSK